VSILNLINLNLLSNGAYKLLFVRIQLELAVMILLTLRDKEEDEGEWEDDEEEKTWELWRLNSPPSSDNCFQSCRGSHLNWLVKLCFIVFQQC